MTHRKEAIEWARNLLKLNPYFLDTETTGTGRDAEILSVSVCDMNEAVLYTSFVKPRKPIDEQGGAFKVNGITNEMVKNAPTFKEVWESELKEMIGHQSCCAWNVGFDRDRIQQELRKFTRVPDWSYWDCAMQVYGMFEGTPSPYVKGQYKWHKLTEACEQLGIPVNEAEAHGSLYDTLLLVRVVNAMAEAE